MVIWVLILLIVALDSQSLLFHMSSTSASTLVLALKDAHSAIGTYLEANNLPDWKVKNLIYTSECLRECIEKNRPFNPQVKKDVNVYHPLD